MTFELRWLIVFGLLAGPVLAQETEAVSAASEADAGMLSPDVLEVAALRGFAALRLAFAPVGRARRS